jgi:hypothetical protein
LQSGEIPIEEMKTPQSTSRNEKMSNRNLASAEKRVLNKMHIDLSMSKEYAVEDLNTLSNSVNDTCIPT